MVNSEHACNALFVYVIVHHHDAQMGPLLRQPQRFSVSSGTIEAFLLHSKLRIIIFETKKSWRAEGEKNGEKIYRRRWIWRQPAAILFIAVVFFFCCLSIGTIWSRWIMHIQCHSTLIANNIIFWSVNDEFRPPKKTYMTLLSERNNRKMSSRLLNKESILLFFFFGSDPNHEIEPWQDFFNWIKFDDIDTPFHSICWFDFWNFTIGNKYIYISNEL